MPTPPSSALTARLEQALRDVAEQRKRANRGTLLLMIVGVAAIALLGTYFVVGYRLIDDVTQPEKVVVVAEQYLNDNLTPTRLTIEGEVKKNAPIWAEGMSKSAVQSAPDLRKKAEELVVERFERSVDDAHLITEKPVRALLQKNKVELTRLFDKLAKSPEATDAEINELVALLESELKADLQAQSKDLRETLTLLVAMLKKLGGAGANLEEGDQKIRLALMTAKRIYLDKAGLPDSQADVGTVAAPRRSAINAVIRQEEAAKKSAADKAEGPGPGKPADAEKKIQAAEPVKKTDSEPAAPKAEEKKPDEAPKAEEKKPDAPKEEKSEAPKDK